MRYFTPEINRFFVEEAKMAFIAGPRQVGKTRKRMRSALDMGQVREAVVLQGIRGKKIIIVYKEEIC
jgi:predicted AAA+ superfamily ATPase